MNIKEAQYLLKKLKPLENIATTKNGFPIHKFFIIPLKFIQENNLEINWYELWNNEYAFQQNIYHVYDHEIVAVHRNGSMFLTSTNLRHFKDLVKK